MDNVFKMLRIKKTKGKWNLPFTQSTLAKKMGIKQQTIAKAENGDTPSYKTVKKYHEYFGVPYNSLFGEGTALEEKNTNISKELHLSDEAINTIKQLSPNALALLDTILSDELAGMKLESNYNYLEHIHTINSYELNPVIAERELNSEKYILSESVTDYLIKNILPKIHFHSNDE